MSTIAEARGCSRCESVPEKLPPAGMLYMWFPLGHSRVKAIRCLRSDGWAPRPLPDGCLRIEVTPDRSRELFRALEGVLSRKELQDSRAVYKADGAELGVADFGEVQSLHTLAVRGRTDWMVDLLAEQRLTTYFQPIVWAGRPGDVYGQECLLRGLDPEGGLVPPRRILDAAHDTDAIFQLDLAARQSAIHHAVLHGARGKLFINFTPTAIYDPAYCLRSTIAAIDSAAIPHEDVVFEVVESEKSPDPAHLRGILDYYRAEGFKVALDDIGSGYSSLNLLHQVRPDYVKLDMELIRDVAQDSYKALIAEKLLEIARRLGILTIAEGVETPEELAWVREHGATFVQGYLLGRPSSVPQVRPAFQSPQAVSVSYGNVGCDRTSGDAKAETA